MTRRRARARLGLAGAIILCGVIGVGALRAATPATGLPDRVPGVAAPAVTAGAAPSREHASGAAVEPRGNPLWAVPLSSLTATRGRPLFSSSRRPPAQPVVAAVAPRAQPPKPPPAAPLPPSLVLVGTVTGPAGAVAVFTDTTTSTVVRLHTREAHAGWILHSVGEREVTLQKDGRTAVLALPRRDSMQAAAPPAAEPIAPQRIPLPVLRRP
jgi:general secretion pathway protein N